MNRRRFLSSTMLGGAALVGLAGTARAFNVQSCSPAAQGDTACGEFQDHYRLHKQLLADLKRELDKQNLTPEQEQAILAKAVCPICGAPLIG
ncbi:MAG TPA: hypothetical protein VGR79_12130 [Stellaceae bacterium]|nr:hypothetical protein [Stellaceae bacterium]